MRKIAMFNMVSVDGFFSDEKGGLDWQVIDDEFNKEAVDVIQQFDTVLLGRVTYDLFEDFWPHAADDPKTSPEDRAIANKLNEMTKVVFSRTPKKITWQHSELHKSIDPADIKMLKTLPGKDIVIYGSGTIVQQLTDMGLIDEYRFMVMPIILGKGKPLFKDVKQLKLKLANVQKFKSGNMLVTYERD